MAGSRRLASEEGMKALGGAWGWMEHRWIRRWVVVVVEVEVEVEVEGVVVTRRLASEARTKALVGARDWKVEKRACRRLRTAPRAREKQTRSAFLRLRLQKDEEFSPF